MTATLEHSSATRTDRRTAGRASAVRRFVGGFFLVMGGINAGIVAADPETYRTFADGSFWSVVTRAWHDIVMTQPLLWFLLLAGGEVTLGLLLLRGAAGARAGWAGVIAFHVLLMSFGFGFWVWSVPVLLILVPTAMADWPALAGHGHGHGHTVVPPPAAPAQEHTRRQGPAAAAAHTPAMLWSTMVLAGCVVAASLFGLMATSPYRSLPEATVAAARAQDACSILVAVLLVALVCRPAPTATTDLVRLGLLGYLTYSYLIYVTGVPMNRVFLVYVAIVALAGAGLVTGLVRVAMTRPATTTPSRRLAHGTGWMLVVTGVLFAGLWLSTLIPFAFGGSRPDPEGVGGAPYPVFWLDLAIVLPLIVAVGVLLLRNRASGPALAVVALIKIVTLFTALWAGPLLAVVTGADVHLGPDTGPSLLLLVASTWLVVLWLRSIGRPQRELPEEGEAP